eukprot:TRINITY_DN79203_c0_g1_i1.p1 TRINITY_DN79203_c0_g1~~TRINITY_DN79203_c0_g1_i1.p1  ORF type:complete len:175 (+),score=45.36 TRINITY_DN79203_c0_g1_i1:26-550(+)
MAAGCEDCLKLSAVPRREFSGLPGAFASRFQGNPAFLEVLFAWQDANRRHFLGFADQEFPLDATVAYNEFLEIVDRELATFLAEQGATAAEFASALEEMKVSDDPRLRMVFNVVSRNVDFASLASLLRKNICLCCGGIFRDLASEPVRDDAPPRTEKSDGFDDFNTIQIQLPPG